VAEALKERYGGSVTRYNGKAGVRFRLSGKKSWRKVSQDAKVAWRRYRVDSFLHLAKQADEISARPIKTLRTAKKRMMQEETPLWSCRRGAVDRSDFKEEDGEGHSCFSVDQIR